MGLTCKIGIWRRVSRPREVKGVLEGRTPEEQKVLLSNIVDEARVAALRLADFRKISRGIFDALLECTAGCSSGTGIGDVKSMIVGSWTCEVSDQFLQ